MEFLSGKRVLVLEDEALIAAMVEDMLTELGAIVVGPAPTVERGMSLATEEDIDAAVLDVNIRSARADPVADILRSRGIPVVFATGYGKSAVDKAGEVTIIEKPYTQEGLASALGEALRNQAGSASRVDRVSRS